MGSGPKGKRGGKPKTAVESGTPVQADTPEHGVEETLVVPLVEIDARVFRASQVGDAVDFILGASIEVHAAGGRLGNVPEYFEDAVRARGQSRGSVSSLSENPLAARVAVP